MKQFAALLALTLVAFPVASSADTYATVTLNAQVWAGVKLFVRHFVGRNEFGSPVYLWTELCETDSAHPTCSEQVALNAGNQVWTETDYFVGGSVRSQFFDIASSRSNNFQGDLTLNVTDGNTPTWERCHTVGLLNCPRVMP